MAVFLVELSGRSCVVSLALCVKVGFTEAEAES